MAITLSTGAQVSIAKTFGTALTVTAISNANPAIATSAAHGLSVGDYIEISSGWGLLDKRVVRCGAGTATDSITLEGVNTTDTTKYPAGAGVGTAREITAWSQMTQVKSISSSGGTQNFADVTTIVDTTERKMPTTRAAIDMTLDVYDDPSLAWYTDIVAADEARTPYGMLMSFANGSKLTGNAYWSVMRVPTITQNEALMTQVTLAYASEPIRYAT